MLQSTLTLSSHSGLDLVQLEFHERVGVLETEFSFKLLPRKEERIPMDIICPHFTVWDVFDVKPLGFLVKKKKKKKKKSKKSLSVRSD